MDFLTHRCSSLWCASQIRTERTWNPVAWGREMGWREARVLVGLKEEAGALPSQQIVWGIWLEILSKRAQQKSKQREPLRSGEHACCRQWKEAYFFLNTPFQNSSYRYFCFIYFSLLSIEPRSLLMIDKFSTTEHHPYVFFFFFK